MTRDASGVHPGAAYVRETVKALILEPALSTERLIANGAQSPRRWNSLHRRQLIRWEARQRGEIGHVDLGESRHGVFRIGTRTPDRSQKLRWRIAELAPDPPDPGFHGLTGKWSGTKR